MQSNEEKFADLIYKFSHQLNGVGTNYLYRHYFHQAVYKISELTSLFQKELGQLSYQDEDFVENTTYIFEKNKKDKVNYKFLEFQNLLLHDLKNLDLTGCRDVISAWNKIRISNQNEKVFRKNAYRFVRASLFLWNSNGKLNIDSIKERILNYHLISYYGLLQEQKQHFKNLYNQPSGGLLELAVKRVESQLLKIIQKQEREVFLEEANPTLALLRGVLANDCESERYPFYALLKNSKIFFIRLGNLRKSEIVGSIFVVKIKHNDREVPYIITMRCFEHLTEQIVKKIFSFLGSFYNEEVIYILDAEKNRYSSLFHDRWIENLFLSLTTKQKYKIQAPNGWERAVKFKRMNQRNIFKDPYADSKKVFHVKSVAVQKCLIERKTIVPSLKKLPEEIIILIQAYVKTSLGANYYQAIQKKFNKDYKQVEYSEKFLNLEANTFFETNYQGILPLFNSCFFLCSIYKNNNYILPFEIWYNCFKKLSEELEYNFKKSPNKRKLFKLGLVSMFFMFPKEFREKSITNRFEKLSIFSDRHKIFKFLDKILFKVLKKEYFLNKFKSYFLKNKDLFIWETKRLIKLSWDVNGEYSKRYIRVDILQENAKNEIEVKQEDSLNYEYVHCWQEAQTT